MINLDIEVPEQYENDMVHCCRLLQNEEFASFVEQRYPLEHKLYTGLALKIQAERAPDARAALIDEFCRACFIVINVAQPAYSKYQHARLLALASYENKSDAAGSASNVVAAQIADHNTMN